MKNLKEVYKEDIYDDWAHFYDYGKLVDSMDFSTVLEAHDDDYQGDSYYLLKSGETYGFLTFGWGSCSGCDALQNCSTIEDVEKLRAELLDSIQWKDSEEQAVAYLSGKDWDVHFGWYGGGLKKLLKKVNAKYGTTIDIKED